MSSKVTIGCLTIGQSPRPEIRISDLLPRNCRLTELVRWTGRAQLSC